MFENLLNKRHKLLNCVNSAKTVTNMRQQISHRREVFSLYVAPIVVDANAKMSELMNRNGDKWALKRKRWNKITKEKNETIKSTRRWYFSSFVFNLTSNHRKSFSVSSFLSFVFVWHLTRAHLHMFDGHRIVVVWLVPFVQSMFRHLVLLLLHLVEHKMRSRSLAIDSFFALCWFRCSQRYRRHASDCILCVFVITVRRRIHPHRVHYTISCGACVCARGRACTTSETKRKNENLFQDICCVNNWRKSMHGFKWTNEKSNDKIFMCLRFDRRR